MIRFIGLSGFLGAGKTTTLLAAARHLQLRGRRVAVITNDQGTDLVDTRLVKSSVDRVGEVTGGCFCCRFDDLVDVARTLVDDQGADTILAESVGSCTDVQATVVNPLKKYYGDRFAVAPLTTVVEPDRYQALASALPLEDTESDLSYLFGKQLEEADVIALNKSDTLPAGKREELVARLARRHPTARVLPYSAATAEGMADLVDAWWDGTGSGTVLEIDYDRYAHAEAELAWLNQGFHAVGEPGFVPHRWAATALQYLSERAAAAGWLVGHAKVSVRSGTELTKLSVVTAGAAPVATVAQTEPVRTADVQFNARVVCDPAVLEQAVRDAVRAADSAAGCASTPQSAPTAFRPGYPVPVHRIRG
ncbi:GTP-binding protein [Streptomyces odontomachi]|uniref:GTP-binding protein n=1 Tax=Streptomyces odontomachi TaxID=2944940 RepID=UPI002108AF1C|nr:GTP-binding protein [Streptomyces sp. ODS25]